MAWLTTSMTAAAAVRASTPSGSASRLRDGGFGGRVIDRQVAGEQRALVEIAEQQVAVGDGRLGAAAAVARRARASAPALLGPTRSAPARSTQAIEPPPADTSARSITGTRIGWPVPCIQRLPLEPPPTSYSGRGLVLAVADQAGLGGGAAHVEGEQVAAAGLARHQRGRHHAGGRARTPPPSPAWRRPRPLRGCRRSSPSRRAAAGPGRAWPPPAAPDRRRGSARRRRTPRSCWCARTP